MPNDLTRIAKISNGHLCLRRTVVLIILRIQKNPSILTFKIPVFSGVRVARSLVFCVGSVM